MSLINEMLRDLEKRRAGELRQTDLQREIRPLPERRPSARPKLGPALAALSLAAATGGGIWWYAGLQREAVRTVSVQQPLPTPPAPSLPTAAEMPVPVPTPQPPVQVAAPTTNVPPVPPAALSPLPSPRAPAAAGPLPGSPVSVAVPQTAPTVLAKQVAAPTPIPQPTTPAKAVPAKPVAMGAPAAAAPLVAKPNPIAAPAAPQGSIEKTISAGTPRERADAEYRRAQALLAGGQANGVVELLQGALKQDASHNPARQLLVRMLLESRRHDEAMAVLQDGLEQQPAQIGWAMSLARLLVERSDLAGAERVLARSGAYGRNSDSYAGFHGHLLNRLGQFREAAEEYQTAARLAPADGRWWFGLGQSLEGEGRAQEARGAFRRALEAGNLNADLKALAEQKVR